MDDGRKWCQSCHSSVEDDQLKGQQPEYFTLEPQHSYEGRPSAVAYRCPRCGDAIITRLDGPKDSFW